MYIDGKSFAVAEDSGKYSAELCTVYAKEAARVCRNTERQDYVGKETELHVLAKQSKLGNAATVFGTLQGCTTGEFLYPGAPAGAKPTAFKEYPITA